MVDLPVPEGPEMTTGRCFWVASVVSAFTLLLATIMAYVEQMNAQWRMREGLPVGAIVVVSRRTIESD